VAELADALDLGAARTVPKSVQNTRKIKAFCILFEACSLHKTPLSSPVSGRFRALKTRWSGKRRPG
jgi:hypothetical protein